MMLKFDDDPEQTLFFGADHFGALEPEEPDDYRVYAPAGSVVDSVDVSGRPTRGWDSEPASTPKESETVTVHDWRGDA